MNESDKTDIETADTGEVVIKDRSLLYGGIILGIVILVMGYLALFVEDPSKIFRSDEEKVNLVQSDPSILDQSASMSEEEVRSSLVKFIEAFYYDQRRGYFDPPSYFADITETFYNYHNLTHKRLKEIYWQRLEDIDGLRRNWIVSTLEFNRANSRITATYWAKESYFRRSLNADYSAQIKYELVINEMGKIVSLREAEVRNVEMIERGLDTLTAIPEPITLSEEPAAAGSDKVYDFSLVESQPEFPGGQNEFVKYIGSNLKYPPLAKQKNVQGKVYVSFIVEKDGHLADVKIKQGIGSGCDEEAVRVLRASPKWKPGMIAGKPVRTYFVLPITFQI